MSRTPYCVGGLQACRGSPVADRRGAKGEEEGSGGGAGRGLAGWDGRGKMHIRAVFLVRTTHG